MEWVHSLDKKSTLMKPKMLKCSYDKYRGFFGLNQKSISLKLAEIGQSCKWQIHNLQKRQFLKP